MSKKMFTKRQEQGKLCNEVMCELQTKVSTIANKLSDMANLILKNLMNDRVTICNDKSMITVNKTSTCYLVFDTNNKDYGQNLLNIC